MRYGSIFIKNVYYMLAYAFRALRLDEYEDLAGEDFEHMHDLFAAVLAKGMARQVKQGLYRTYQPRRESLPTVRGRIDPSGTMRHAILRERRVSCEYDELSEDNPFNRVLKTTALLLLGHGEVSEGRRAELRRTLPFFSDVEVLDPSGIRWDSFRFQRNNLSYRVLLGVCRLVLEGMLITTEEGELKLARFVDDQHMCRLFEKFVLEYYRAERPDVRASSPQIRWALDDGAEAMLPVMQSDVVLSRGNDVLIIDAKFYAHATQSHYDVAKLRSAHLYQIFTYVKNEEAELAGLGLPHEVSGMLLYARTDEAVQPDGTYQMSGNRISVRSLDLDVPFEGVRAQLDGIVDEHFREAP
ncbi:5-methylcytosine-specific restriction endonuclease system specificity protein McrC [Olsenella sp. YH-ols2223]|uniref:5-methylcytosine-specific restriction endonuclease system specificity protein McrC n=1 Tax=Olsenella absiana TaxID=3115222 RepID=A0ABU7R839_9ACTN